MDKIFVKILGCGASVGCPIPGCNCEMCKSNDSKNNRTRSSIYIKYKNDNILIDCGPNLRDQMLRENLSHFDYVFLTHKHLDHIAGMDDLRISFFNKNYKQIKIFANQETFQHCITTFEYMFHEIKHRDSDKYLIEPDEEVHIVHKNPLLGEIIKNYDITTLPNGLVIQNYEQHHGKINSLGYMIGRFAYSTDLKSLPEKSLELLKNANLKLLVLPLTHFEGNNAHASFEEIKKIIQYIESEKVILTHMSHKVNYTIDDMLPSNAKFCYDGMEFEI